MADYFNVPKAANYIDDDDTAPNEQFYSKGITLFDYDNYNHYKIAYASPNGYNIRVGVVRNFPENYTFVLVSPLQPVANVDIRLISPYITMVGRVENILNKIPDGYDGYFNVMQFSKSRMTFHNINIFDDVDTCAKALSGGEEPQPGENGVIVTGIGTPVTPSDSGVIVTGIGKLLDPNQQGGISEPGGGHGTFDETSDPIPIPPLPELSATDSGLVTLFRPSSSELKSLASYLWTNITDIFENLNKFFVNPTDYLISLNIFPCNPPVGENRTIHIGALVSSITMPPVTSQWYQHNCGTVSLPEYWGSALDYAPNTKVSLFLPFIGSVTLNTDEVMGKRIGVIYRIDLLSGQCVAMVSVNSGLVNQTSVIYQFTGECSVPVPLTGSDWSRIYAAAFGAIGTAITGGIAAGASGAAAGGATAALAGANAAEAASNAGLAYSMINDTSKGVKGVSVMREQMLQASQMALEAGRNAASAPTRVSRGVRATRIANTVNNTLGAVMSGKGIVQHSGTVSGSAGMLGVKVPYLLIEYPNQSLAENYKHYVGYPSNMYARLGTLSGYTECEQVIPKGLSGQTDSEVAELLESLKGGVYLNFNNVTVKGTGIILYNYTTSPNTVGKGAVIVETLSGTFRSPVSITDPLIVVERSSPVGFNYVYIEAFDRFYYVKGVSADLHGLITISCTVDTLETNAVAIQQTDAIIKRQENKFNLYLDDGIFKAYQNTKHKIIAFPNGFTEYSYILALASNSDS